MSASAYNSSVEALTLDAVVFRGGASGKWLGLDEVMKVVESHDVISAIYKEEERLELSLSLVGGRTHQGSSTFKPRRGNSPRTASVSTSI